MRVVLGVRDTAAYQTDTISSFSEFIFYPGEAYNKKVNKFTVVTRCITV